MGMRARKLLRMANRDDVSDDLGLPTDQKRHVVVMQVMPLVVVNSHSRASVFLWDVNGAYVTHIITSVDCP